MRRLFNMMSDQVQVTAQQLQAWWAALSPDPRTWAPFTWVLAGVVLVILLTLIIRPRRRAGARRPELLISHGELRVAAWAAPKVASSLQAPDNAAYELAMTVSNLSASPVQLLELAVRTNGATVPTTAEVAAVLPPHGAVDVTAELREAGGDEGVLDLFVYVPDMPPKTFRVRAKLRWEPWNARYRVLPLEQRVDVARGVGERTQRRQASAWRHDAQRDGSMPGGAGRARRSGQAAYNEDGRFAPRAEFAQPRSAPSQAPDEPHRQRAEQPERPPVPEAPPAFEGAAPPGDARRARHAPRGDRPARGAGPPSEAAVPEPRDELAGQETWPPARPDREAHRARVQDTGAPAWPASGGAARDAADEPGHEKPDDVPDETSRAWRLGDAERLDERAAERAGESRPEGAGEPGAEGAPAPAGERAGAPANERAGMGRAARAARGTRRDGPSAAGGDDQRSRPPRAAGGSGRARGWAVGSRSPERLPDPGQDELVGPDEGPPPTAGPRRQRAGTERAGDADAGRERARREASGDEERLVERRAEGRRTDEERTDEERTDRERARERPRLEFPDEF